MDHSKCFQRLAAFIIYDAREAMAPEYKEARDNRLIIRPAGQTQPPSDVRMHLPRHVRESASEILCVLMGDGKFDLAPKAGVRALFDGVRELASSRSTYGADCLESQTPGGLVLGAYFDRR
jgi:hypothetical protein